MRRRKSEAPALPVISDFANAPTLWAISGHNSVAIRAGPDDEKATFCDDCHFNEIRRSLVS